VAVRTVTVLGLFAAIMLLGMACTRLAGGPLLYVRGLDQAWGESAYLVTQFVGIQLFGVGGLFLLASWIAATATIGLRRRAMSRAVAFLAVLPAVRLGSVLGLLGLQPESLWFLSIAAIPAAFLWLLVLGAVGTSAPGPVPGAAPLVSV
jgi:hypothetical protein